MDKVEPPRPGFLSDLSSLSGRGALILGGHGELAAAMAAAIAECGANVAFAARKEPLCADLAAAIARDYGVRACKHKARRIRR